jgi:hypothetical protein
MSWTPAATPGGAGSGNRGKARHGRSALASRRSPVARRPKLAEAGLQLVAAVIAIADDEPMVEVVVPAVGSGPEQLPTAQFYAEQGHSLDAVLRAAAEAATGHQIGYLQQLLAFAEPRSAEAGSGSDVLIGYLTLVNDSRRMRGGGRKRARVSRWQGCYQHLPWEDWRAGRPRLIDEAILPRLQAWAKGGQAGLSKAALTRLQADRAARVRLAFAGPNGAWDEDKVQVRFNLLVEAGLIEEEPRDEPASRDRARARDVSDVTLGRALAPGHRRILAAAIGQLRTDTKLRPVVFELMDDAFSLYELQRTVEAILGPNLHKQNFRRLIETAGLVEATGEMKSHTGGRPAKLYRFRRDVLLERPGPGVTIKS